MSLWEFGPPFHQPLEVSFDLCTAVNHVPQIDIAMIDGPKNDGHSAHALDRKHASKPKHVGPRPLGRLLNLSLDDLPPVFKPKIQYLLQCREPGVKKGQAVWWDGIRKCANRNLRQILITSNLVGWEDLGWGKPPLMSFTLQLGNWGRIVFWVLGVRIHFKKPGV